MKEFNIKLLLGYCIIGLLGYAGFAESRLCRGFSISSEHARPLGRHCITTPAFASTQTDTKTLQVTATVPDLIPPTVPFLIAPENASFLSNPQVVFIFKQSTDIGFGMHHYDLYLNNALFIKDISPNQSPIENDQIISSISGDIISVMVKQPFSDGVYNWKVTAVDNRENKMDSSVWTFTIDTKAPFIIVTDVGENNNLNLTSEDPASIPPDFTLYTSHIKPVFRGRSEPGTSIWFTLLDTSSQYPNITFNDTTNNQGRFEALPNHNLISGIKYKVTIISADAASNTMVLPEFYLIYNAPPLVPVWQEPEILLQLPTSSLSEAPLLAYTPYLAILALIAWIIASKYAYGFSWLMCWEFIKFSWLPFWWPRKKNGLVFNIEDKKGVSFAEIIVKDRARQDLTERGSELANVLTDLRGWFWLNLCRPNGRACSDEEREKLMVSVKCHGFWPRELKFANTINQQPINQPAGATHQALLAGNQSTINQLSINHQNLILIPLSPNPQTYKTYLIIDRLCWIFLFLAFLSALIAILLAPSIISLLIFILCLDLAVNMLIY